MRFKPRLLHASSIAGILLVLWASPAFGVCAGSPHNPITEVCWHCMFPFKIGGVTIAKSPMDLKEPPDLAKSPVCICPFPPPIFFRIGIPVSFWEPARFIESVKDAFCFPSLGFGLTPLSPGFLNGGGTEAGTQEEAPSTFQQTHYAIYPVYTMMEILTDFVCLEHSGFDIAYMTEIDPTWNDDLLAEILYPESLLFANLPAQLSCIADSVGSNAGLPLSPLFWCMGSWGSTYPMSGHVGTDNLVQGAAATAARIIYKMGRTGTLCDTGLNLCSCVPTPLWVKHNYRLSLAKPVRGWQCIPIGRSSLIWGAAKNPPLPAGGDAPDNFMYIVFRKRACCAF